MSCMPPSWFNRVFTEARLAPYQEAAARSGTGSRNMLHDNFEAMRRFRNRVMHHEPVHHRHLEADHAKIYRLLGYIEPDAAAWLSEFDQVPEILARRPGHGGRG